jgi:hypothetical protein
LKSSILIALKVIRARWFYIDHLGSAIHSARRSYIDPKLTLENRYRFQIRIEEELIYNPISLHRKTALFSTFALKLCSFMMDGKSSKPHASLHWKSVLPWCSLAFTDLRILPSPKLAQGLQAGSDTCRKTPAAQN